MRKPLVKLLFILFKVIYYIIFYAKHKVTNYIYVGTSALTSKFTKLLKTSFRWHLLCFIYTFHIKFTPLSVVK